MHSTAFCSCHIGKKRLAFFPLCSNNYVIKLLLLYFKAYDVAVEHFLSALNFQAAGRGLPTQNNTTDLPKVMSDNIWSSLRLTLGLMGKRDLNPFIEQRDLKKLNQEFNVIKVPKE